MTAPLLYVRMAVECPTHGWVPVWLPSDWRKGCPTCRNERQRRRSRRTAEVRNPPRPAYERQPGACSLCGLTPLPGKRRSWCSDECVALWHIATSTDVARRHLVALHGHACWCCGADIAPGRERPPWADPGPPDPQPVALAVDHVRPLWSLSSEERGELRWWLPFNLQLLCPTCHKAKTAEEAAERARRRRGG